MTNDKTSQLPALKQKLFYGYVIVLISFLILVLMGGSRNSFGIFLKPMLTDLEFTRGSISGATSIASLIAGTVGILMGRLLDKFGPRSIMTICGVFTGIGYLLMSLVTTTWQLYLFYGVLVGIGIAAYVPTISTVTRWFKTRRNIMTAIVGTGASVGTLIVPLIGDWLISTYDWRFSFVVFGITLLIGIAVSAQFLRPAPDRSKEIAPADNTSSKLNYQFKGNDFSLRKAILSRPFWLLAMMFFISGFSLQAIVLHIVPYATDQGISSTGAASILSFIGFVAILGRLMIGGIADRFGESAAFLFGFILKTASMVWLLFAKELWMLYLFAIPIGLSFGIGTVGSPLIADIFGLKSHGSIFGACIFAHSIGVAIGPLMAGYIFDLTNSYIVAFLIITLLSILGIILTILLQSIQAKQIRITIK